MEGENECSVDGARHGDWKAESREEMIPQTVNVFGQIQQSSKPKTRDDSDGNRKSEIGRTTAVTEVVWISRNSLFFKRKIPCTTVAAKQQTCNQALSRGNLLTRTRRSSSRRIPAGRAHDEATGSCPISRLQQDRGRPQRIIDCLPHSSTFLAYPNSHGARRPATEKRKPTHAKLAQKTQQTPSPPTDRAQAPKAALSSWRRRYTAV